MWVKMSSRHRNLIIVRAGPGSLHANWLEGGGPVFDVLVAAYHPDAMAEDTERVRHKFLPGAKVAGWNAVLSDNPELLDQYDRIAFIDDDVDATTSTINKCFKVGERYALQIWQPALSADSYITYAASLRNPRFELRFCNYVEMMCPFFHTKLLKKIAPLFAMGFESGIDLIWCSIANENGGLCAVVDGCIVRHTRPVGRAKDLNGFVNRRYETDIYACLERFGMRWPSWVVTGAISRNDKFVRSNILLSMSAASALSTVPAAPPGTRRYRTKAALDYLRHQATRPPYFGVDVTARLGIAKVSATAPSRAAIRARRD